MKLFLVLVLAVSAVVADDCDYQKLKDCNVFEELISKKQWPQNITDVAHVCNLFKNGDACVKAFNDKCIKNPDAKSIADEIHAGLVKHYSDVCGSDKGKQDFLNRVQQCYGRPSLVGEAAEIHQRYVGMVEKISTYGKKRQLPAYCCAVLYFGAKIFRIDQAFCGGDYGHSRLLALDEILKNPIAEVCGEEIYLNYETCYKQKLTYDQQADFDNYDQAYPPVATKYENALPTLYEIFNKNFN